MPRLSEKVCLITGASRGIGEACARAMHAEGAVVVLTDVLDAAGARVAGSLGARAEYLQLDVRHEAEWVRVVDQIVARHGWLDVLVNNAGIIGFEPGDGPQDPEHCTLEHFRKVQAVNVEGAFLGCKHAIRVMKPPPQGRGRGGSIVNMSSRSGLVGIPTAVAYAASKAAIRNHTKSVALYCAEQRLNIRCNSLHPGAVLTPMWDMMLGTGAEREAAIHEIASGIPLGHMGDPTDVAHAVVYLASDESRYITGAELSIDGGILAGSSASPKKS